MKQEREYLKFGSVLLLLVLYSTSFLYAQQSLQSEIVQVSQKDWLKLKNLSLNLSQETKQLKQHSESLEESLKKLSKQSTDLKLLESNLRQQLNSTQAQLEESQTALQVSSQLTENLQKSFQDTIQEAEKIERQNKILKTSLYITGGVAITFGVVAGILLLVR